MEENLTYKEKLWNKEEFVYETISNEIKMIEMIFFVFNQYKNLHDEYSEKLDFINENFFDLNEFKINKESSYFQIISNMKKLFTNISNVHKNLSEKLNNLLTEDLKNICINKFEEIRKLNEDYQNSKKNLFNSKKKLEEAKNLYNDDSIKKLEEIQKFIENKNGREDLIESLTLKFSRQKELISNIKIKNYVDSINVYNLNLNDFIKISDFQLENFQKNQIEYIKILIDRIFFYTKNIKETFNSIIEKTNEFENNSNNFNIQNDINNFILKNKSITIKPTKEDFEAFNTKIEENSLFKQIKKNYDLNIVKKVNEISNSLFCYISPELHSNDEEKNKKFLEIKIFSENSYKGQIEQAEIDQNLNKILAENEKDFLKYFLDNINKSRAQLLTLSEKGFNNLKYIFTKIILNAFNQNDYEIIQYVIILSQTFYKEPLNNKKILLQDELKNIEIFKLNQTWKILIENNINKEIINQKINENEINNEENKLKLQNIIFSILITFKFNMESFDFDKEKQNQILKEILDKYNLKDENGMILDFIQNESENIENNKEEIIDNLNQEQKKNEILHENDNNEPEKFYENNNNNNENNNNENENNNENNENNENK